MHWKKRGVKTFFALLYPLVTYQPTISAMAQVLPKRASSRPPQEQEGLHVPLKLRTALCGLCDAVSKSLQA